jgi:hypothetical protein
VILSVTTLKDSLANVSKFVSRNLNGGVDHVVVFLDAEQPEVAEFLTAHPDVTCVPAYGDWWDVRPDNLNQRQATNSGMVSRLLEGYAWADWVFHIDGDEVVHLDLDALAAVDPSHQVVRLAPWEAVARLHPEHDPTSFKRLLDDDQLQLLCTLGVLGRAHNKAYFRGHIAGKLGARPSRHVALAIHKAWTGDREEVPVVDDGRQHVLHYESPNGDEFVRKWLALLSSGGTFRQRGARVPLTQSLTALLDLGLGEAETSHFLEEIYQRYAVDDVETLDRLGVLEHVDADLPRPARPDFPASAKDDLRALLERVELVPKRQFRPMRPGESVARTVEGIHRDLGR